MNAVTETTKTEYVSFETWQSVRKLANEIGVPFYSAQTYSKNNGIGLKWDRFTHDRIDVAGYLPTYGDNDYMRRTVSRLAKEKFMLQLELWALKNNMEFVYVKRPEGTFYNDYIQIAKKA